jgi:hypothetical protein
MKMNKEMLLPYEIPFQALLEGAAQEAGPAPLAGAVWYEAREIGDGLAFAFSAGALAGAKYLTADLLLDGERLAVFSLTLQEGENGAVFRLSFGLLNECQARLRMPLEAVDQNRWRYEREGAWLKPICMGERVDLGKVDRMALTVYRKSREPVRWCMTPLTATLEEPPRLEKPLLRRGKLLDELGQSALHEWQGKTRSVEELTSRLQAQLAASPSRKPPDSFSRWGGWKERRFEARGFFYTHKAQERWWLVDPDGYAFWSSGLDCVRVDTEAVYGGLETALTWLLDLKGDYAAAHEPRGEQKAFNYLAANFIRAFGKDEWYARWSEITLAELRQLGFNTVANWSDWEIARAAGTPYVRPLPRLDPTLPTVYRDFPDVFHPDFVRAAEQFAQPLEETRDDPAFIGYFLMNEPTWGFAQETPAAGMLFNTPHCHSRRALADFLRLKYASDGALSQAWKMPAAFERLADGDWTAPLTPAAQADLADFSEVMVQTLFGGLSAACRRVDPRHLNLGIRYYTIPPRWALKGMRHFDVFSMNCYKPRVPAEEMAKINELLDIPILVGEWHFGAHDAGLPACGIGHVPDQESRGKAFRFYVEDAAAKPWCVGVHYFNIYDQSALGRFDGENYNIGFLDVCNRPYEPLAAAARLSHERLYAVAAGDVKPVEEQPKYLPLLFL